MRTLLTLAACAAALAACSEAPSGPPEPPAPILQGEQLRFPPGHPQLAQVGLATASPGKSVTVELPARLVWNEERTQRIYPAFAGRVARIVADVGQPVKPGTVLAVLASPEFGAAQADAAKAQVDQRLTQKNLQRQRELFDAGVISRKDFESAEADAARAQAESQRASARTHLYGAAADAVNQNLALTSGIAGFVVERNLTPGQELRPDQMGSGTPPMFVLSDPSTLWVQIDARESEAETLRPGSAFELAVPALGGRRFEGKVTATSDAIDPATRTIKVRGVVANPERRLKAEMLATAIVERTLGSGVVIPARAITLRGTKHFAIVQPQPGVFEWREVTIAYEDPRIALVSRGLEAGEKVASENMLLLARQFRIAQDTARK